MSSSYFRSGDNNERSIVPQIAKAGRIAICALIMLRAPVSAEPQATGKVVGLGAVACSEFLNQIRDRPVLQREYLAWAQGLMSAILLSRPPEVDRGLDLLPPSFPLTSQLAFLREYCQTFPESPFVEAGEALYKRLRFEGRL